MVKFQNIKITRGFLVLESAGYFFECWKGCFGVRVRRGTGLS